MRNCRSCKYWSEVIAQVQDGQTVAMCVSTGPRASEYMPRGGSCPAYVLGMPVDLDCVPPGQRERSVMARLDNEALTTGEWCDLFADGERLRAEGIF